MAKPKDEFAEAAFAGDLERLREVIKAKEFKPSNQRAKLALVSAAEGDQVDAAQLLLDWGVPVESADVSGRRAFYIACKVGSHKVVQELIKRGVDITEFDAEDKMKPLDVAVNQCHLLVCKALLKAGAKLKDDQSCKGLAAIVAEVKQEVLVDELKVFAETAPDVTEEILEADAAVWELQQKHMRLLWTREEVKAAATVSELEKTLDFESCAYSDVKQSEDALSREVGDLRISLLSSETAYSQLRQLVDSAEFACQQAVHEEAEADIAYKAELAIWTHTKSERDECDKANTEKELQQEENVVLIKRLQEEVSQMHSENKTVAELLKAESAELRGWERDKEAAAAFTAQAHSLLGARSRSKAN